ncbi:response regulator transcription factor [Chitinophaga pinensis]|uniref:Two component transcriptional regulator, LuxR family n=1 Tax=Chitinophaga pinensis (strain ATCC 43595 / DSM 2588 / LMG 13176 / NBRC 15968 / NCIMB 11800 / UQM 2034) TaxID=485918 RepID=A0A979G9D9_CHIPD|nr:response regulator transcription factor [Chitinophaga pinensis]ACU63176.1 two component transcriptional regulator, LuxR family [Chitinophaga pinensis DSM 2588]
MNYILIAHEPSIMRCGLSQIISMLPAPVTVMMVETPAEMASALEQQPFDLLILSRHLPGNDTLSMMKMVREKHRATKILLFSSREEKTRIVDVLFETADGYLSNNSSEEDISLTISILVPGHQRLSSLRPAFTNPLEQLSSREIEVMNLLAQGLPLLKIAAHMELQVTTVSTYKTRIFKKLEINSIVELLDKVRTYGIRKLA